MWDQREFYPFLSVWEFNPFYKNGKFTQFKTVSISLRSATCVGSQGLAAKI